MHNRVRIDLTQKKGTIGNVLMTHRDEVLSVKSSSEAHTLLTTLFAEAGINTPKSRGMLVKLQMGMSPTQTLLYLNNTLMKSAMMGV